MKKLGFSLTELSCDLICNAVNGQPDALETLIRHYDGYINAKCAYEYVDENGILRIRVDHDMKSQVQIKLVEAIKKWRELP